jgi:indolepyruvate decarboxylase
LGADLSDAPGADHFRLSAGRRERHLRSPDGYLIERALEENPNWTYNDLARWKYAELPKALGCADWFTARVTTLGELDAMKAARASKTGAYIEIIGGKLDMPPALAFAHGRLKAMYGDTP